MVLGSSCAVLGFIARLFGTHFMLDDRKLILENINKTLDMNKIAHLAPASHPIHKNAGDDAAV